MIECKCGDDRCETVLCIDSPTASTVNIEMTASKADGRQCAMYLDANGIVELIQELQETLLEMGNARRG